MQIKKILLSVLVLGIATLTLSSCTFDEAASKEASQVADQQKIYVDNQPVPAFDWSLERHIFSEIYKARNNAVITYSYVRNMQGQIYFECKSMGFPLSSNMQLTAPESEIYVHTSYSILPQAEPNGLFSSPSSMGTYVMCVNPDGTVSPNYFEDDVETHTSPLAGDGRTLTGESTLKIKAGK